jgi:hypothetical protein
MLEAEDFERTNRGTYMPVLSAVCVIFSVVLTKYVKSTFNGKVVDDRLLVLSLKRLNHLISNLSIIRRHSLRFFKTTFTATCFGLSHLQAVDRHTKRKMYNPYI